MGHPELNPLGYFWHERVLREYVVASIYCNSRIKVWLYAFDVTAYPLRCKG